MTQHRLFDELDTQAGEASALPKRRVGAPAIGERAAWGIWEARLLPGFVAPYCQSLAASRLHRSCWWVDGLAAGNRGPRGETGGAGARGAAENAGAFAEAAEALAASGFSLRGLRLESRKPADKASSATRANEAEPASEEQASAPQNGRKASENARFPGSETLVTVPREDLLTALGTSPAILLLNPFAAPPLTADVLLPLCQRQAPTELLLTISTARLEQMVTQDLADHSRAPAAAGAGAGGNRVPALSAAPRAPALTALLRSDTWKTTWSAPGKSAEKVRRTLEMLRGVLKAHFLYVCVAALDDLPSPAPRRLLLFASRQYASVALLNDFLCAEQARLARERETRALQGSWFARRRETARAAAWAALKEELHTLGRLRRARLWPDLKPLLVLDHFGQFSAADHDAALLELLREGRIACRWSPAASSADSAAPDAPPDRRVPGPQDFLEFLEARTRPVWRR